MSLLAMFAATLFAVPASGHVPTPLAGVADEETTIPSGGISQFHRGKGDVLFVLDRAGRWYRLGLNEGCLSSVPRIDSLSFGQTSASSRVDRFTMVLVEPIGGTLPVSCRIESIRRSEAPPQIESKTPVTLD